jgi:hypothetical protein
VSGSYQTQVLAAARRAETLIAEISLTKDRSEVSDFELRAMETIAHLRPLDRERLAERLQRDD